MSTKKALLHRDGARGGSAAKNMVVNPLTLVMLLTAMAEKIVGEKDGSHNSLYVVVRTIRLHAKTRSFGLR
jgi:hypothetical protein